MAKSTTPPVKPAAGWVILPVRSRVRIPEGGEGAAPDGLFHGAISYRDLRIEKPPTDEAGLKILAELFPPSCIFDECGSVLYDSGAMQYIGAIVLEPAPNLRAKITIRCHRHMPYPPLLSLIDPCDGVISIERGEKFDWVFALDCGRGIGLGDATFSHPCRYHLEIR